jgi:hypothetical protein
MAPASFMMEGVDMGTSDIVPPEGDVPPPTPAGEEIVPPSEEVPLPEEPVTPDVPAGEVIEEPAPAAPVPAPSPAEEVVV